MSTKAVRRSRTVPVRMDSYEIPRSENEDVRPHSSSRNSGARAAPRRTTSAVQTLKDMPNAGTSVVSSVSNDSGRQRKQKQNRKEFHRSHSTGECIQSSPGRSRSKRRPNVHSSTLQNASNTPLHDSHTMCSEERSYENSLASSTLLIKKKKNSSFDIDAPTPRRKRLAKPSCADSVSVNDEHANMTPEQRAWAGIDQVLQDSASIATRDVLPEEIVHAMSHSTLGMTSIVSEDDDESYEGLSTPAAQLAATCKPTQPAAKTADMPELMNSSFSSVQSELSSMSKITASNFIVQPVDPRGAAPMTTFLGGIMTEHERRGSGGIETDERASQQQETEDEEGGNLKVVDTGTDSQLGEDVVVDSIDESEDEQSEDNDDADAEILHDDPPGRRGSALSYIPPSLSPVKASRAVAADGSLPTLVDSSFSSIDTELTGIQSLLSSAKNYVVDPTGAAPTSQNPMTAFLDSMIARNLVQDENVPQYEAPPDHDDLSCLVDDMAHDHGEEPVQAEHPDCDPAMDASIPSLSTFQHSDLSESQNTPTSRSMDWNSWVDSAFRRATEAATEAANGISQESSDELAFAPALGEDFVECEEEEEMGLFTSSPAVPQSSPTPVVAQRPVPTASHSPKKKGKRLVKKKKKKKPKPQGSGGPKRPQSSRPPPKHNDNEEVISMSPLRSPKKKLDINSFDPFGLPQATTIPASRTVKDPASRRKKDKYRDTKSPLQSLRSKMSSLSLFKGRRGSPASVLDTGRGEAQFFPTIDEEEEEDWGGLLS